MRVIAAILLVLVLVLPALAQNPATPPAKGPSSDLASQLLEALQKYEYKAKRDIPAADSIFVEKNRVQEAMYKVAMQTGGILLKSGATTKVSSVKLMDHGVQVFFETDKCALINVTAESDDIAKMSLPKVVEFTKGSVKALFQIVGDEPKTPAAATPAVPAPETKEKPAAKEEKKPNQEKKTN